MCVWMSRCAAAVIGAALVTATVNAGAHPPLFTDAETEERAEELGKRGNALSREGRLAEAIEAYRDAFKLNPTYGVAANLGVLELKLARHRDAAEHLAFALRVSPADAKPSTISALKDALSQAALRVVALRIRVTVAGSDVTIDGQRVDNFDLGSEVYVAPGQHSIAAARAGHAAGRRVITASAGTKLLVELTPTPLHAPHAGAAPENAAQGAPDSGATAEPAWRSPLVAAGAGAAGVGVALGMILTVTANGRSSRVASLEAQLVAGGVPDARARASLEDARAAQRGFTRGAAGSFAAAGALALATAALALWSAPARPAPAARALPIIGPSWGGLAVEGTF